MCSLRADRVSALAAVFVVLLGIGGCAQLPSTSNGPTPASTAATTEVFAPPNDPLDPAWRAVNIRFKTPTTYIASAQDGTACIRAKADGSWSFWVADVPAAFAKATQLAWRWFVPSLVTEADNEVAGKDDAPARVVVAFKGDRATLDAADRATMNLAKALGGVELPYAAIQYIWAGKAAVERVIPNANTARIKKLVVRSGGDGLNEWQAFSRDVRADFRRAFPGEEPGEIESVGLMTDTDSLGGKAEACYADVRLR
jgi:Protein of unknown function (DUF3047)